MSSDNFIFNTTLAGKNYDVFFYDKNDSVFSANKIYKIFAVFESPYIDGGEGFMSWKQIKASYNKYEGNEIYFYVKNTDNIQSDTLWQGPFLNEEYDISTFNKSYLRIMVVMSMNYLSVQSPVLNSIRASYYKVGGGEQAFFTKTFDLTFKPKNILLTYNGTIPDSTILRFAIAGKETTDEKYFYTINPNTINDIYDTPGIGNKLKLMISGVGNKFVPFVLDEFAFVVSGDKQVKIS